MSENPSATRAPARVALVTCTELLDLDPDDRLLLGPLAGRGLDVEAVAWDASNVDWSRYDLTVLRSPWDYSARRDEFVAWTRTVPRLANPADVVRWNTDKRYLRELAEAGVPTVDTEWLAPGETWDWPSTGEYVVKPAISAGSQDTGRYDLADLEHRQLALAHLDRLHAAGRVAMIQPYLTAVDTVGETALLFFAGPDGPVFSHAIRKGAMLTGPDQGLTASELFRPEKITPSSADAAQHAVAQRVLAAVPGGADRLLYARVDLIPGPTGTPVLVELELTEPSLFFGYADGAAERFAAAVLRYLG